MATVDDVDPAPSDLEIRRAEAADRPQILDLMAASLGWERDARHDALFAWKHEQNPFGPSPAWVAVEGGRVLGFRTFMRWGFVRPDGGTIRAVRAVDTATHPDARGRGLFRSLTLAAIADLEADGVDWIFNTPNDQSRPGYLKMGWAEVGRLTLAVRPRLGLGNLVATARSRDAHADLWPAGGDADGSVVALLEAHGDAVDELLLDERGVGVRTQRTRDYLSWRYGFTALGYRATTHPDGVERGFAIGRLRRRGEATEYSVCELVVRPGDTAAARAVLGAAARAAGPDFLAGLGPVPAMLHLRSRGPVLTARTVCAAPPRELAAWELGLGDIELF